MKPYVLLLMLIFLLGMQSCTKQEKEIKVGFLIHSKSSARWKMDIQHLKDRAQERGISFDVKSAEGDENVQLKQATEFLQEGVDVLIVVAANQNTSAGIVRQAHDYNVPVIAYDRLILNSELDYLVSFEYDKVGKLMVDYAVERKPKGN